MKRKIITINEDLCNGCGDCVVGCSEGALQIINGKAKLVREDFCDGFGDCVGHCPTGALKIEEKETSAEFDEEAVKKHLKETQGEEAVRKMEEAQQKHATAQSGHGHAHGHHHGGGCPGMRERLFTAPAAKPVPTATANTSAGTMQAGAIFPSELRQWPVQLHLVNPRSDIFKNKEMVVLSTCSPIASADVHWKYMRGRSVVVACPKLDDTDPYVPKLAQILSEASIPKVIVLIMEVPCCRGLGQMVQAAAAMTGRSDLIVETHIMSLEGQLKQVL